MKKQYLNIKITWGDIIHNDNTIKRTMTSFFSTKESMREAWNERDIRHTCYLNTRDLSMSVTEFVSADEYFDWEE